MKWYERNLDRNPLLTIAITAVVVIAVANVIGLPQWIERQTMKIPGLEKPLIS